MASRPRDSRFELVDGPLPIPQTDPVRGVGGRPRFWLVGVVVAAVLLVVVTAVLRQHRERAEDVPTPPPIPSPTVPASDCDLTEPGCRVVQADRWRDQTAAVLRTHLDPEDHYFTGYSWGPTSPYEQGPRLNALGLEVYRLEGGGTEVFIQIAKSRADALRCGELTHHRCVGQRFMDGNRFSLTPTTQVADGIEVQYSPAGTYVITLVGRNTTAARPLPIGIGDLIAVAQDVRLQPPPS